MKTRESKNWFNAGWDRLDKSCFHLLRYNCSRYTPLQRERIGFRAQAAHVEARRLTAHEILDETVAFYSEDTSRRGIHVNGSDHRCVYESPNGCKCAVGRCLLPDVVFKLQDGSTALPTSDEEVGVSQIVDLDKLLQPKYRGQPTYFWETLQNLHDRSENWDDKGITGAGVRHLEEIRHDFTKDAHLL